MYFLLWCDWEMRTAVSCTERSQVADLIPKVGRNSLCSCPLFIAIIIAHAEKRCDDAEIVDVLSIRSSQIHSAQLYVITK